VELLSIKPGNMSKYLLGFKRWNKHIIN